MSWYFVITASSSTAAEQRQPNASSKTAEAVFASEAFAIFSVLLPSNLEAVWGKPNFAAQYSIFHKLAGGAVVLVHTLSLLV